MRLGEFRIDKHPTYAGAIAALGRSSSCRLIKNRFLGVDRTHAIANWPTLGVAIELRTYGSLPRNKTACTAPQLVKVHTVRATGKRWHTSRGLHIGDWVGRLRRLYPSTTAVDRQPGWYARGYWLVTRNVGGYGGIGGVRLTAPVLVAEIAHGRVSAFVIVVDAEGD
jgi:hypothetical protein